LKEDKWSHNTSITLKLFLKAFYSVLNLGEKTSLSLPSPPKPNSKNIVVYFTNVTLNKEKNVYVLLL
jgi:hypothetical protein